MDTPVYPPQPPAISELHRSYAHAARLGRTVAELQDVVTARDATIEHLEREVRTLRRVAYDIENHIARGMGELAARQLAVTSQATVSCVDSADAAFLLARGAALTERIRSLSDAREVYRRHRPSTAELRAWLLEERDRWDNPAERAVTADDAYAQRSAQGWSDEAAAHRDSLDRLQHAILRVSAASPTDHHTPSAQ